MSDDKMDTSTPHRPGQDQTMALSLEGRSAQSEAGSVTVPVKPNAAMLAAGARAAGVSVEVAWKIYRAMVLHDD